MHAFLVFFWLLLLAAFLSGRVGLVRVEVAVAVAGLLISRAAPFAWLTRMASTVADKGNIGAPSVVRS